MDPEKWRDEGRGLVGRRGSKCGVAMGAGVRAFHEGLHMSLADGLKLEVDEMVALLGSNDAREGFIAFTEKRTPTFSDS